MDKRADIIVSCIRDSNVILWLSAIYSELHKYTPYHVNSVRDYFERSTQDTRTRPSILLWKCYIQFELMQDNTQKARSLFYRSIRECPWSKGKTAPCFVVRDASLTRDGRIVHARNQVVWRRHGGEESQRTDQFDDGERDPTSHSN